MSLPSPDGGAICPSPRIDAWRATAWRCCCPLTRNSLFSPPLSFAHSFPPPASRSQVPIPPELPIPNGFLITPNPNPPPGRAEVAPPPAPDLETAPALTNCEVGRTRPMGTLLPPEGVWDDEALLLEPCALRSWSKIVRCSNAVREEAASGVLPSLAALFTRDGRWSMESSERRGVLEWRRRACRLEPHLERR